MCINELIEISKGFLTPVIACITVYIAYQQLQATRKKMKMDNYERRLKIYQETQKFIRSVCSTIKPEYGEIFEFVSNTAEADFLFPDQIREYLDEIFKHAIDLHAANVQYSSPIKPKGYDHQKICDAEHVQSSWFMEQSNIAKEKFKQYLDIYK